jgi:hypothetical protein
MKNQSFKATQKLVMLISQNLWVHPDAKLEFKVWQ